MRSAIGPVLRMAGPLVQVACLIALLAPGTRGRSVAGVPIQAILYGGFAVGFVLVLAGLALSRPARRPGRREFDGPRGGEGTLER